MSDVLCLKHSTSGTLANNIGVGLSVGIEDASDMEQASKIEFVLTDKTDNCKHQKEHESKL